MSAPGTMTTREKGDGRRAASPRATREAPAARVRVARAAFALCVAALCLITAVLVVGPDAVLGGPRDAAAPGRAAGPAAARMYARSGRRPAPDPAPMCARWDERDCRRLHGCAAARGGGGPLARTCSCYSPATRRAPTIFLLGCQTCGSTSVHAGLVAHRQVVEARDVTRRSEVTGIDIGIAGKELHFFDNPRRFARGFEYYLCHFPLSAGGGAGPDGRRAAVATIDSTPDYIWLPWVAPRILETYRAWGLDASALRFIAVLRDPLRRLQSWYNMSRNAGWLVRRGHCTDLHVAAFARDPESAGALACGGTFESAVADMVRALDACVARLSSDGPDRAVARGARGAAAALLGHEWDTIFGTCVAPGAGDGRGRAERDVMLEALLNGLYSHQLRHWLRYFGGEQLFVTTLDAYAANASALMEEVFGFIGVSPTRGDPDRPRGGPLRMNSAAPGGHGEPGDPLLLSAPTRAWLCDFYSPFVLDLDATLRGAAGGLSVFTTDESPVSSWCGAAAD